MVRFIKPQARKETSCKCNACKNMCRVSPCFPTPAEADKLMELGYYNQLKNTTYLDITTGQPYTVLAPELLSTGCVFLTEKGLCELHEKKLKPLEGRLAHHELPDMGLRAWVAAKWQTNQGIDIIFKHLLHA